jgi:hypothetical protein
VPIVENPAGSDVGASDGGLELEYSLQSRVGLQLPEELVCVLPLPLSATAPSSSSLLLAPLPPFPLLEDVPLSLLALPLEPR